MSDRTAREPEEAPDELLWLHWAVARDVDGLVEALREAGAPVPRVLEFDGFRIVFDD